MLLFSNLPHDCSEGDLRKWMESRGVKPSSVRIIRDTVSESSPAFGEVELRRESPVALALATLNGMKVDNRTIHVRHTPGPFPAETVFVARKPASKPVSHEAPR